MRRTILSRGLGDAARVDVSDRRIVSEVCVTWAPGVYGRRDGRLRANDRSSLIGCGHWGFAAETPQRLERYMYIFTRSARLAPGNLRDSMSWAVNMTEKVNQISEAKFRLWSTVDSPGVGTLSWATTIEDLEVLEATNTKLIADSGYHSLVEQGAKHLSADALDDNLIRLIVADADASAKDIQYVSVNRAVLAPGHSVRGIEIGIEIAQRAKKAVGRPVSFGAGATGEYGAVAWIGYYDSVQQLQKAQEALAADADFAKYLDKEAAQVYLPSGSSVTWYRRVT